MSTDAPVFTLYKADSTKKPILLCIYYRHICPKAFVIDSTESFSFLVAENKYTKTTKIHPDALKDLDQEKFITLITLNDDGKIVGESELEIINKP